MIDTIKRHELQRADVERVWAKHLTASAGERWHERYIGRYVIRQFLAGVGAPDSSRTQCLVIDQSTILNWMIHDVAGKAVQEVADTRVTWLTLTPPFKVDLLGKGRKWRTCPLWESTVQHLRQLIEERKVKPGEDGFLFVNPQKQPLSRSGIANLIARYTAKAAATTPGLQSHKVTPHTFRHTTAMHLLQTSSEAGSATPASPQRTAISRSTWR